jgi:hypothetical protein
VACGDNEPGAGSSGRETGIAVIKVDECGLFFCILYGIKCPRLELTQVALRYDVFDSAAREECVLRLFKRQ